MTKTLNEIEAESATNGDIYRAALTRAAELACYEMALVAREEWPTAKFIVTDTGDQDYSGYQWGIAVLDADGNEVQDESADLINETSIGWLVDSNKSQWKRFAVKREDAPAHTGETVLDIDAILTALEAEDG